MKHHAVPLHGTARREPVECVMPQVSDVAASLQGGKLHGNHGLAASPMTALQLPHGEQSVQKKTAILFFGTSGV